MTPQRAHKVQALFAKATRIKDPAKRTYLKEACRGQPTLRAEVESLLRSHQESGVSLGVPTSITGKRISHYDVRKILGGGGMGVVYDATDVRLDRRVALKVLPAWMMGDARNRDRLVYEAKCASALNHPNIVTVYELGHDKGVDLIVMEYMRGKTLDRLTPSRRLPASQAVKYAIQILEAVNATHASGILHSDLKPLNVMVTDEGRVKLLDFGLARGIVAGLSSRTKLTVADRFVTRDYLAPELWRPRRAFRPDARSESFTVGLLLHQMLGGRQPF